MLAREPGEQSERRKPGKAGRHQGPEEGVERGAVDDEKVGAEEQAGEQRQTQAGYASEAAQAQQGGAPVRPTRLRDKPDRNEGKPEADHRGKGGSAQNEEPEDHRDEGGKQRRDRGGDGP